MNATLQNVGGDDGVAFSVATFVLVPEAVSSRGEEAVAVYLEQMLGRLAEVARSAGDAVSFEVEVGPEERGD